MDFESTAGSAATEANQINEQPHLNRVSRTPPNPFDNERLFDLESLNLLFDDNVQSNSICSGCSLNQFERITVYSKEGKLAGQKFLDFNKSSFLNLFNTVSSGSFVWIDITNPTENELYALQQAFSIHALTVEDIQTEETREKVEFFGHLYFMCFKTYNQESTQFMEPINVYTMVIEECVILSFHCKPILFHVHNIIERLDLNPKQDASFINYCIVDSITDSFMPIINVIQMETDSIDDLVLILKDEDQQDMLRRIGYARKKVTFMVRLVNMKSDVIKKYLNRNTNKELDLYYNDILDHLITMTQNIIYYEKVLSRAYSNYLAQISIELTQTSNKTNDVVAKLTALASVLLPLNVITGLWGMNVKVPGQYDPDNPGSDNLNWFFAIVAGMTAIAVIVFIIVKKSGIL